MCNILNQLDSALAPVYPTLVLSVTRGETEATATVHNTVNIDDIEFEAQLTPSVAMMYASKASLYLIDGDEVDAYKFTRALQLLLEGRSW